VRFRKNHSIKVRFSFGEFRKMNFSNLKKTNVSWHFATTFGGKWNLILGPVDAIALLATYHTAAITKAASTLR
jgi:hypothetical protein